MPLLCLHKGPELPQSGRVDAHAYADRTSREPEVEEDDSAGAYARPAPKPQPRPDVADDLGSAAGGKAAQDRGWTCPDCNFQNAHNETICEMWVFCVGYFLACMFGANNVE